MRQSRRRCKPNAILPASPSAWKETWHSHSLAGRSPVIARWKFRSRLAAQRGRKAIKSTRGEKSRVRAKGAAVAGVGCPVAWKGATTGGTRRTIASVMCAYCASRPSRAACRRSIAALRPHGRRARASKRRSGWPAAQFVAGRRRARRAIASGQGLVTRVESLYQKAAASLLAVGANPAQRLSRTATADAQVPVERIAARPSEREQP
jgi:hypothetical protein